jgi:hypothetical protein
MAMSFTRGKKVGVPPKTAGSKKDDSVTAAKTKAIEPLRVQNGYGYVHVTVEDKPPPKANADRKTITWFYWKLDDTF